MTKIDGAGAALELRLQAPDMAGRDALRSKLVATLARRFADAKLGGSAAEAASFS